MRLLALLIVSLSYVSAQSGPADSRAWINQGVQSFKNGRYAEAVAAFQRAVELSPGDVTARLYLGTAFMQQYIPGSEVPENVERAQRAETEFQRVVDMDPVNQVALQSLASLALNRKHWDDAVNWYRRELTVNPNDKTAYYSLAFITWARWYPALMQARTRLGMRPETPGPITDASTRAALRAEWWNALDEAMFNLNRALELDPQYDDAMAYMNLLIRERGDLRDTEAEYRQDVVAADNWVSKALETKRAKAGMIQPQMGIAAPPPPPPPPPPPARPGGAPQTIRVGGGVQQNRLVRKVDAAYPPLALQARVSGNVMLSAVIGRDGAIANLQVISGHPLLVPAALDAVKQWVYQPTLLNGEPVEVVTQIEVPFRLPN